MEFVNPLPEVLYFEETRCGIPLSVEVNGTPPFYYQWQVCATSVFVDIPGATNRNYTTPRFVPGDEGIIYRIVVTNTCGSQVQSDVTFHLLGDVTYPQIEIAAAYATNRVFIQFDPSYPMTPGTPANFTLDHGIVVRDVITNTFDLSMMELLLDPSTPLVEGVDYALIVRDLETLPPISKTLDPNPTTIDLRLDAWNVPLFEGPLHLIPQLRWTNCASADGCVEVHWRPDYLIWDDDRELQYSDSPTGPWIDLPYSHRGHPMVRHFHDCDEHAEITQMFFRLAPQQ